METTRYERVELCLAKNKRWLDKANGRLGQATLQGDICAYTAKISNLERGIRQDTVWLAARNPDGALKAFEGQLSTGLF